ncbi:MAG TPA: hypothetical protein VGM01_04770, partial [Ktedonobacteraceae bacterium]
RQAQNHVVFSLPSRQSHIEILANYTCKLHETQVDKNSKQTVLYGTKVPFAILRNIHLNMLHQCKTARKVDKRTGKQTIRNTNSQFCH